MHNYCAQLLAIMAINAAKVVLQQGKSALFICDLQESFKKAIFEFDKIIQNSSKLVNLKRLRLVGNNRTICAYAGGYVIFADTEILNRQVSMTQPMRNN